MKRIFLLMAVGLGFALPSTAAFKLHRGVNISHWLSQSDARGAARAGYFTEKDVAFIASCGFDHLRIPVDEEQLFRPDGQKDSEAFSLLHNALHWCRKHKLRAVVDLHILRSHHFNAKVKPLFTEEKAQEAFYRCWRLISSELKGYSNSWVAYELMNEPVADEPEIWNVIVGRCAAEVRKLEPKRTIIIGSNRWQSYDTVKDLRIPGNDRHIILSFHYYNPFLLTHYTAPWTDIKDYTGAVHYPGKVVQPEDLTELPEPTARKYSWWTGQVWNSEVLARHFELVLQRAEQLGVKVYCGEYGCLDTAPEADRYRWYADMDKVLEQKGIARAVWDYKGGFGIIKHGEPDWKMIHLLTGK
ncbi:MAG: glycoside hydrolase family 5 protein [Prevotella sp.]